MSGGRRVEKIEPGDEGAEKAMAQVQGWARQTLMFLLSARDVSMGTADNGDESARAKQLAKAVEKNVLVMWGDAVKSATDLPTTIHRFSMLVMGFVTENFMDPDEPAVEFQARRVKDWSLATLTYLSDVRAQKGNVSVASDVMTREAKEQGAALWGRAKSDCTTKELEELVVRFTRKVLQEVEASGPIPDPTFE